jgi:stress-induced-phosphoprotein 1
MGKTEPTYWDKVMETCEDLIKRRYEMNAALSGGASFEKVAKVFCRMASVHEKRNEFDQAIEMYNKALMEDNARGTRNALRDVERAKEKFEKESYIDHGKAEEHNEKAKEFFKNQQWADAKREYDEAIRRNPGDAKLYSNRAAALTKLMAHPDALRDLDECLRLDPTFIKAYSRKGVAHFFMKEYHKCLQAYEQGLKIDPKNEECLRGREQVVAKIQENNRSGEVDEEQVRHAMADPEIQNILKDPQINLFLKQMQENPRQAQDQMNDPKIAQAVQKLMAAGILKTG